MAESTAHCQVAKDWKDLLTLTPFTPRRQVGVMYSMMT